MSDNLTGKQKIILASVFALSVFLIIFRFTETPGVWVDEGIFTETAKNLAWHGEQGVQTDHGKIESSAILATAGYPLIWPVVLSFKIFGTGIWQARLPMLLFMFLLVVLFFVLVKKKYGFYSAIISVLLLSSFSPFYGNGRCVQGEVVGLVFIVLGALFFLFWESKNFHGNSLVFLSGISFGLAASSKPLYLIVLIPSLFISLLFCLKRIFDKKSIFIFCAGFILPVVLWLFVQFPTKEMFLGALKVYFSGNPDASANALEMIRINFLRFFTESTPALFLVLMALAIFSFAGRLIRKEIDKYSVAEFILLSFVVFNWLAYLKGPGWYRHFFPAHILLYLLLPGAILYFKEYFSKKAVKKCLSLFVFLLIAAQFYHLIFLSQTSFVIRRNRNADIISSLSEIQQDKKVFFINSIEAAIFLKGDNYAQYLKPSDFLVFGEKELARLRDSHDTDYIFLNRKDMVNYQDLNSCYMEDGGEHMESRYALLVKRENCL